MKYQYEDSIKEVLKVQKGVSEECNRKIFENASAAEKSGHKTYFYLGKPVVCALTAFVVLLSGGIGIAYAAGVKPVRTVLDQFTHRYENDISKDAIEGIASRGTRHKLELSEYYLDALGYGYMTFSLTTVNGEREWNTALGNSLEAYYIDADQKKQKFGSYGVNPIDSKDRKYIDGIRLEFYGSKFQEGKDEIVIKMWDETFTFSDIRVTQPHYYEWTSPEGKIYLSGVGLLAEGNTPLQSYISGLIGTDKDSGQMATITYKDGHHELLQLNSYCGGERDGAVIQFSPWTQLQKHLEEKWTWEEIEEEWKYNCSIYTFALDEISKLQFGDIVLDVAEASYH